MKTIEIVVNPQGEVKVETKAFTGGSCREASKLIEQALGSKVSEQTKAEYYIKPDQSHVVGHHDLSTQ